MNEINQPIGAMASSAPARQHFSWLTTNGPTILVITLLGLLAWRGHQTNWTIPKVSELFSAANQSQDDWCPEHSVPESLCVECNDSLLPRQASTWCRQHGVHNCPWERPETAQLAQLPHISSDDLARAQQALALKERPENNPKCKLHHRRLQVASTAVLDKMGIEVLQVDNGYVEGKPIAMVETISASGEITFAQPLVANISSPVAGRIGFLTDKGQLGATVKRGEVLALVDALEVGKAKAEFLQAFAQLDLKTKTLANLKPAVDQNAVPFSRWQELQAAQREAQIRLLGAQQALSNLGLPLSLEDIKGMSAEELSKHIHFLGIPEFITRNLDAQTTSANLLPLLAPRDGVVTAAQVTIGEVVDPTRTLFVVADTSRMWLTLNVRSEDVKYLRIRAARTSQPGHQVVFRPDGGPEVTGELVWKSAQVDEHTRTVRFRAELPNPDGILLANTFGTGHIILREEKKALAVPSEALHWEGHCHIVFVRDKNFLKPHSPKVFHVRTVRPGVKNGPYTEIIAGLLPGEVIATKNSASFRAELLKNNLGAG